MADPTCVRCESTGVVRRERTIKGDTVTIEYTCGRCQHTWRETDLRTDKDRRTSRTDRRKTRR